MKPNRWAVTVIVVEHPWASTDRRARSGVWPHVLIISALVSMAILRWLPLGPTPAFVSLLVLACGIGVGLIVLGRRNRVLPACAKPGERHPQIPPEADGATRLVCYGTVRELAEMQELTPVAFEPYFPEYAWDWLPRRRGLAELLFALAFLGWAVASCFVIVPPLYTALAACAPLWVLWASGRVGRPYIRVVPGRLDLLRGQRWLPKVSLLRSVDLRNARIECRFDRRQMRITPCGREAQEPLEIDLAALEAPHAFAKVVFQAAVCDRPAPPLPEDALLG